MFTPKAYNIGPSPGAPGYQHPQERGHNRRTLYLAVAVFAVLGVSVGVPTVMLSPGKRGECWCRTVLGIFSYGPAQVHHSIDGHCYRETPQHCRCDTDVVPVGHAHLDRGPHIIVAERGRGTTHRERSRGTTDKLKRNRKEVDLCGGCENLCSHKHVTWGKVVPRLIAIVCLVTVCVVMQALWRGYQRFIMSTADHFAKPATFTL